MRSVIPHLIRNLCAQLATFFIFLVTLINIASAQSSAQNQQPRTPGRSCFTLPVVQVINQTTNAHTANVMLSADDESLTVLSVYLTSLTRTSPWDSSVSKSPAKPKEFDSNQVISKISDPKSSTEIEQVDFLKKVLISFKLSKSIYSCLTLVYKVGETTESTTLLTYDPVAKSQLNQAFQGGERQCSRRDSPQYPRAAIQYQIAATVKVRIKFDENMRVRYTELTSISDIANISDIPTSRFRNEFVAAVIVATVQWICSIKGPPFIVDQEVAFKVELN